MIHHVTRKVPPSLLDECVAFYGILGFQPVPAPAGIAGRATWLELRNARHQVHLMPVSRATASAGHFAIVCDDYDATVSALRKSGAEVEPRREHWGSPRAYARDPVGNVVELMAWPPGPAGG